MSHAFSFCIFVFQSLIISIPWIAWCCRRSQEDRAIFEGDIFLQVRTLLVSQCHRQVDSYYITLLPCVADKAVTILYRHICHSYRYTVEADGKSFAYPWWLSDSDGVGSTLVYWQLCLLLTREIRLLCQGKVFVLQCWWCEEVHIQSAATIMCVDEVSILWVILHTCSYAAPHILVHLTMYTVSLWTQRCEIYISACYRVYCWEDVVIHSVLVEVRIFAVMSGIKEALWEFQHIVRVTALWSVTLVDISVCCWCCHKPFIHGVTTDADSTVACHICPEIPCCCGIVRHRSILLCYSLKTYVFWHLCIGMSVIQEGCADSLHAVYHCGMAVFLCCVEVFCLTCNLISISKYLVYSTMFCIQNILHRRCVEFCNEVYGPVTHL